MKAYHICYHTDEDGVAAAAVIYEYLKKINKVDKKKIRYFFYKIDYTMDLKTILPVDIPAGDEIYFVDYSFSNIDNLNYILELSNRDIMVTWIDHHKTSVDILRNKDIDLSKYPNFHRLIDDYYCGAYLAYVYAYFKLHTKYKTNQMYAIMYPEYIPLYIRYVNSWDTWKHDMPNTVEFNLGMRSVKHTPRNTLSSMFKYNSEIIDKLFSDDKEDIEMLELYMQVYINDIIYKGKIIKTYQDVNNESLCNDYGFELDIIDDSNDHTVRGYHCFALNKRGNSTMFGDRINKYDIVIAFQFNGDKYVYSLYTSKDNVDCESLAKKLGSIDGLGGGGHTKAAGFQTYDQIIKANCNVYINNKLFRKNKYNIMIS